MALCALTCLSFAYSFLGYILICFSLLNVFDQLNALLLAFWMMVILSLVFSLFRTFVLLTFDLLDSLCFLFIGCSMWWLVVGLLFGDDLVVLDSLNLI